MHFEGAEAAAAFLDEEQPQIRSRLSLRDELKHRIEFLWSTRHAVTIGTMLHIQYLPSQLLFKKTNPNRCGVIANIYCADDGVGKFKDPLHLKRLGVIPHIYYISDSLQPCKNPLLFKNKDHR
ncbi:uncharacterized [Tachysurus ichikawai]